MNRGAGTAAALVRRASPVLLFAALTGCSAAASQPPAASPSAPPSTSAASAAPRPVTSLPSVGALFLPGQTWHLCTGSVTDSPSRNVVLTAAHCLAGDVRGWRFVPGYASGTGPSGDWTVTAAYVDPAWSTRHDPHHDYAFLTVAPQPVGGRTRELQDATGAADRLGMQPAGGTPVRLFGYAAGSNDRQMTCSARTYDAGQAPSVRCPGFRIGTSGAPWVLDPVPDGGEPTVVGLIGGLHQGGCHDDTSHSSIFDGDTAALLARAASAAPGDTLPAPGDDGC